MFEHLSTAPDPVTVRTSSHPVPQHDGMSAYLALAQRFGTDQVHLLESVAGPAKDIHYQYTGFGTLLTVSVTRATVRVEGVPALRRLVSRRIARLLDTSGPLPRLPRPTDLWAVLRAVRTSFDVAGSASRFRFGFLGFFGYDAARYIERLPYLIESTDDMPDVHLVLTCGWVVTDVAAGTSELLLHDAEEWPAVDPAEIVPLLAGADTTHPVPEPRPATAPTGITDDTGRAVYMSTVDKCLRHIAIGDIYQVQIGHELTVRSEVDPVDVYLRLRRRNPSPYMYLTQLDRYRVIGASPELFVRVEDGLVTMRPIAGTIPRGAADDEVAAAKLSGDPKEIAEHIMLVDLCRNDIGRICRQDTLAVPDSLAVERYSHVLHLVSTVVGQAEPGKDAWDIIPALFPAGTMTGTPKIRAMEIIDEMEHSRRGLYSGALGLVDVDGYVNLALCIRTLIHHDGAYRIRASAGVVADSVPAAEWTETMAKVGAAYWAATGTEVL
jgi:anthranilate synthase component 1